MLRLREVRSPDGRHHCSVNRGLVPIGEVIDKNGRAGLREAVRNGFSNSRAGPCDNGPLILQTFVGHFSTFWPDRSPGI